MAKVCGLKWHELATALRYYEEWMERREMVEPWSLTWSMTWWNVQLTTNHNHHQRGSHRQNCSCITRAELMISSRPSGGISHVNLAQDFPFQSCVGFSRSLNTPYMTRCEMYHVLRCHGTWDANVTSVSLEELWFSSISLYRIRTLMYICENPKDLPFLAK